MTIVVFDSEYKIQRNSEYKIQYRINNRLGDCEMTIMVFESNSQHTE